MTYSTCLSKHFLLILPSLIYILHCFPVHAQIDTNYHEIDDQKTFQSWSLHGQETSILQGYPSFASPYNGTESLPSKGEIRETTTATLFMGAKLWQGGEVYFDPEMDQGLGIGHTYGLAGFANGEGSKAGSTHPYLNAARLFVRQSFGLGGSTEKLTDDFNQIDSIVDVNRITLTIGKISAPDIFDDNSYTHDPRTQFLNWSLMESAAWDFPADSRGYTDGIALEYNQEFWTLRYGAFLEPHIANGEALDMHGLNSLGQVVELEDRYSLENEPGKLRFLAFYNRNRAGIFNSALNLPGDVNTTIKSTGRYGNIKYGFAVNAEQHLRDDLGVFARVSWNDGQTEDWAFTQVDRSIATGLSMQGMHWGRNDDVVGLALVVNGISNAQKRFLENGGTGLVIGDGKLNYGFEDILETYYSYALTHNILLTPDYQLIVNPAYNLDRGPVHVFSGRLHLQF